MNDVAPRLVDAYRNMAITTFMLICRSVHKLLCDHVTKNKPVITTFLFSYLFLAGGLRCVKKYKSKLLEHMKLIAPSNCSVTM